MCVPGDGQEPAKKAAAELRKALKTGKGRVPKGFIETSIRKDREER